MATEKEPPVFVELKVPERSRTYHFGDGSQFTVREVTRLSTPPGRSHRIETKTGQKYIVPPGWVAIEVDVDNWTY